MQQPYERYLDSINSQYPKSPSAVIAETQRNVPLLTNPHQHDPRFNQHDQVVFGTDNVAQNTNVEYVDRMYMWNFAKCQAAYDAANASGKVVKSAEWYEVMLSHYWGKTVVLDGVVAGINRSDGYATVCFYFHYVEEE